MRIKYTVGMDPDAVVSDMLAQWVNGNKNDVLISLCDDHPGLTAMFIVVGTLEKHLTVEDCNYVTNQLMELRKELCDIAIRKECQS